MSNRGSQRWMDRLTGAGLIGALLLAGGCGTTPQRRIEPRQVSLAAFVQVEEPEAIEEDEPEGGGAGTSGGPGRLAAGTPPPPDSGQWTPMAMDEPGPRPFLRPLEVGERVLVDSMVGQVNGKPIFADEFFLPIEDQLLAIAAQSTEREFAFEALQIVRDELEGRVLNALFLAEAEAALTPEQKVGVRYWFADITEQFVAGQGGSEADARERAAQEGTTLEAQLQEIRDLELIKNLLRQKIDPRVNVSWRDVEREYRRRYDEINPPAKATLARIRLSTEDDADLIEQVKQRLEAGEDFLEVAASVDQPDGGIWDTVDMGRDGLREPEFADEAAQAQVARLREVGDTTEPIQLASSTWWLNVAQIDRPPVRSLYDPDIQRVLIDHLRANRADEEQSRYIASLLEKGIYDELGEMGEQLLIIAIRRYGP